MIIISTILFYVLCSFLLLFYFLGARCQELEEEVFHAYQRSAQRQGKERRFFILL